ILPADSTGEPLLVVGLQLSDPLERRQAAGVSPGVGYIVAVFDLKRAIARADSLTFGGSGGVLLTDSRGQPWAGSSRQTPWNPVEALPESAGLATTVSSVEVSANASDRYVALAKPHPGLLLVGSVERAEIGRASQLIAVIVMVLILLAVAAMHRLVYKTVRRVLLTPAENLIRIARDMAAGNLQVPVQVYSSDELGDLGRALRDLGNSLTESQERVALREAEREYAVEELKGARDRAEAASRSKSEFLARMSHEIRTPMNGVLGMTELLGGTRLDRRQQQYAETIRHSAEGLLKIINDILDFSKIEAGKLELDDAPFDVELVAEEAAELLAEAAHAKNLELICQLQPGLRAACTGDGMRLRQVLINLLGNAVKFTERGQVILRVTEQAGGEAGRPLLRFEVEDTGIGIPPESQAAVFDSFSQADGSTTRRYGGTGLGLAISKQLVELMGGQFDLQSTPGQGSTFGFTVPLARQVHAVSELKPESLTGSHILIVDDNHTNRQILREHLQRWQAEVAEAGSGAQALAQINVAADRGEPFDLVVLDHQMPGMSGMDVLKAVRDSPTLRDLRVVLLSSVARMDDDTECRILRVDACLTKPVRRAHLYTALSRVLADRPSDTQMVRALQLEAASSASRLGLRVLLVEDNPVNQEVARGMLEQLGCEVTLAVDGE
ncbi:MAG: ATP-binding protein, partial [Gammaproteobacteria bacterium]|nr:ATP-binding protein [Gammaproteobacteria bacterium]